MTPDEYSKLRKEYFELNARREQLSARAEEAWADWGRLAGEAAEIGLLQDEIRKTVTKSFSEAKP